FAGFHLSGVVSTPRSSSPTSSAYSLEPDKKYKVSVSFDRYSGWTVQNYIGDMQLRHEGHLLVPTRSGALLVQNPQRRERQTEGSHLR
ncbi:hypothetical protein C0J52_20595, partial [Blattella germanica]